MKKVICDPQFGEIIYTKRLRCKSIRIKVSATKGISVSLPFWVTYTSAKEFLEANRKKILTILSRQKNRLQTEDPTSERTTSGTTGKPSPTDNLTPTSIPSGNQSTTAGNQSSTAGNLTATQTGPYSPAELAAIRNLAKKELPARLEHLRQKLSHQFPELDFSYNKVFIKNNRSNWGSCSSKGNINLNMRLVKLPQELCDFIIIHELCHLIHRNHGTEFHKLVNTACGGKEKEYTRTLRQWTIK